MTQPATRKRPIPKREPVIVQRKAWVTATRLVVMGADPGFALSGAIILERERPGVPPRALLARVVETKKADQKIRSKLRVTNDDLRRYTETWAGVENIYMDHKPHALGVEGYRPGFKPKDEKKSKKHRGGGAATKTLAVYGGLIFWALTHRMFVAPFLPDDLKRRFCGRKSASKADMVHEMCKLVVDLPEMLDSVVKSKREHLADAAGHAFLVLEEIDEMRLMLGVV